MTVFTSGWRYVLTLPTLVWHFLLLKLSVQTTLSLGWGRSNGPWIHCSFNCVTVFIDCALVSNSLVQHTCQPAFHLTAHSSHVDLTIGTDHTSTTEGIPSLYQLFFSSNRIHTTPAGPEPDPSCVSLNSGWSADRPINFKFEQASVAERWGIRNLNSLRADVTAWYCWI